VSSSRNFSRVIVLGVAIVLLILPVLGCRREADDRQGQRPVPATTPGEPVDGDWLIRRMPAEPQTLNPITARDMYERVVNEYVYESLLDRNKETLEIEPQLAESYTISDDHLEYTFTLRRDVRFHDGTPLTAHDIAFSFDRIKDPLVDAAHLRNYYRDVESVEVLDDYNLRFTCTEPYWLALEAIGGIPAIPKHVFEEGDFNKHANNRAPVGSGAYKFVAWETGREIVLERNDRYWGTRGHLDRIIFKLVLDDTAALQLFKRGEIGAMGLTPEQWVRQTGGAEFDRRARRLTYDQLAYYYIGWNMRRPFFSDKMVRRALTHLVNREGMLENLRYGFGKIVTGGFYINGPVYDHSIEPWRHEPAEAERLLSEAGWIDHDGDGIRDKDGVPFRFEFLITPRATFAEQLATILKEDLKGVGIEMDIRQLEWATFEQQVDDRKFDAVAMAWSLPVEGDPYQLWHSSQAEKGSNYVGFINAEADEIIEKGRREFDAEKRRAMYRRLHAIQHEEQPYTFLFCPEALVVVDRRFENVRAYQSQLALEPLEWYVPTARQKYGRENDAP